MEESIKDKFPLIGSGDKTQNNRVSMVYQSQGVFLCYSEVMPGKFEYYLFGPRLFSATVQYPKDKGQDEVNKNIFNYVRCSIYANIKPPYKPIIELIDGDDIDSVYAFNNIDPGRTKSRFPIITFKDKENIMLFDGNSAQGAQHFVDAILETIERGIGYYGEPIYNNNLYKGNDPALLIRKSALVSMDDLNQINELVIKEVHDTDPGDFYFVRHPLSPGILICFERDKTLQWKVSVNIPSIYNVAKVVSYIRSTISKRSKFPPSISVRYDNHDKSIAVIDYEYTGHRFFKLNPEAKTPNNVFRPGVYRTLAGVYADVVEPLKMVSTESKFVANNIDNDTIMTSIKAKICMFIVLVLIAVAILLLTPF